MIFFIIFFQFSVLWAQDFQVHELNEALECLERKKATCENNPIYLNQNLIGEKKFKTVVSYMQSILQNPRPGSELILNEIYHSMRLNLIFPLDPIPLMTVTPHLILDSFGYNSWLKGNISAESSIIDQWVHEEKKIAELNLKNGFDRATSLSEIDSICEYVEPKTGLGTRPGFKVYCDGEKIKVKFKEVHSEPFISRIFWATGFFVDPVDFHPGLKIKYDRKIFTEFNLRKGVPINMSVLKKTFTLFTLKPKKDPFSFMDQAVLKNGESIDADKLFELFSNKNDQEIAYVITKKVQLQGSKPKNRIEIGQWSFNEINHDQTKMIRATMALSAWLSLYDIRRDNNRLVLEETSPNQFKLKLMFSDVGSGLGKSKHRFSIFNTIEKTSDFADTISQKGKLKGIQVNEKNLAYQKATKEDLKVGLRLINQLSHDQIRDALQASGYEHLELEIMLQKLLSRRDQLNQDFK
jgi:hypothetical protein